MKVFVEPDRDPIKQITDKRADEPQAISKEEGEEELVDTSYVWLTLDKK